jgi:hypothetical protein
MLRSDMHVAMAIDFVNNGLLDINYWLVIVHLIASMVFSACVFVLVIRN